MPELPEVETMVRGIRSVVEGGVITRMRFPKIPCRPIRITPDYREFQSRVRKRTIVRVSRRAKRCLLHLDSGHAIVIEPRMTGLMLVADPPDAGHLRVEWTLSDPTGKTPPRSLWFWDRRGLGTVSLLGKRDLQELLHGSILGPDALEVTLDHWKVICRKTSRPIKVLMLDQKAVAGIGNLYASEILHLSGIHPATPSDRLQTRQLKRIASHTLEVLHEAIRYEGSTLGDGTYRNALNQSGGYQNAHRVYDRAEELCPTCRRDRILRIVQAQRSTFYCPFCQSLPGS